MTAVQTFGIFEEHQCLAHGAVERLHFLGFLLANELQCFLYCRLTEETDQHYGQYDVAQHRHRQAPRPATDCLNMHYYSVHPILYPADAPTTRLDLSVTITPHKQMGDCRTEDIGFVRASAARAFSGQYTVCRATIHACEGSVYRNTSLGEKMKPMVIVGALIVAAGLYVLLNGASFTKDSTVLKAGPLEAHMEKKEPIPPWAGGIAVVVGIGFIGLGMRK